LKISIRQKAHRKRQPQQEGKPMNLGIFKRMKNRWEKGLQKQAAELEKMLEPIYQRFESIGIQFPVWQRLGSRELAEGLSVDAFLGYDEIGGVWGLVVKTIERDLKTGAVLGSKVEKLDSMNPFIKEAISKIPELPRSLASAIENQIGDVIETKNIVARMLQD
jgi:hypothetical protein